MGVNSLWTVLDPIKESKSLVMLAEEHHARSQSAGIEERGSTFTVGVDMGTMMAECNAGALIPGVNYQQAGSGLHLFFKRLGEFLKAPIAFIFVLDGPARPAFKRGHKVRHQAIWWTHLAIELAEYFGYQIHQAPGEAEAELAKLNEEGLIHAVITSDSDAYLFGTQCLLRSIPKSERRYPDEYIVYTAGRSEIPLTRDGTILFALLCGGDYDDGIDGCGPATAVALAQCGFGRELLTAFHDLRGADYKRFLIQWRCSIRAELLTNSRKFLSRREPRLAEKITDTFPDHRILDLYTNPITSWSPGHIAPDPSQWSFKRPLVPKITQFCIRHFHWRDPQIIKQRLKENLWEGVFLQMLYSPSASYSPERKRLLLADSTYADLITVSYEARRGRFKQIFGNEKQPKLVVSTASFLHTIGFNLSGINAADRVTVWPPISRLPKQLKPNQQALENKKKRHGNQRRGETPKQIANLQVQSRSHAMESAEDGIEDSRYVQIGERHWFIDLT